MAERPGKFPQQKGLPGKRDHYIRGSIAVDPVHADTIYLGVSNEFAGGKGGGVYVSRDAGETWKRMSEGLPDLTHHKGKGFFENTNVCGYELAVSRKGTPVCMSIVYNRVCRWNSEKKRWETVLRDDSRPWGLADLQIDPFSSRLYLAAKESGLLFSDDDGRTWKEMENFPGGAGRLFFDRERKGRFTVSSKEGLYLTEDNGRTWFFYDFDGKQPAAPTTPLRPSPERTFFLPPRNRESSTTRSAGIRTDPRKLYPQKGRKESLQRQQLHHLLRLGNAPRVPGDAKFETDNGKKVSLFSIPSGATLRVETPSADPLRHDFDCVAPGEKESEIPSAVSGSRKCPADRLFHRAETAGFHEHAAEGGVEDCLPASCPLDRPSFPFASELEAERMVRDPGFPFC